MRPPPTTPDPWSRLRELTSARIALGRAGGSLPTREWLDFRAAHASAREAVHLPFDSDRLAGEIRELGAEVITVGTQVANRRTYLERPDWGRNLDEPSRYRLQQIRASEPTDLAIIACDGLSTTAAERHIVPMLSLLLPRLRENGWHLAPIVVARFSRVALQDQIGEVLGARLALILIGERPGLGSPDSLGAYLVYGPRVGNTDANRNCVSNIRPEGLPLEIAAETIYYLLSESRRRQLSGVLLKDERATLASSRTPSQISSDKL